jgi:pantoate--beta-alanine ligase
MDTVYDLQQLRQVISGWKRQSLGIAFVPTMGNLHNGHLSLLQEARRLADRTVVSIFVNPIQFGKGEDYERYPSTLEDDSRKLEAGGLDLLFAPDLKQLYPAGIDVDTRITVPHLSNILCGKFRPEHFTGVATVVCKLLINVQPDYALFGEKDYQQLLVIRRMATDLCIPARIIGMPIYRETDGLAMSSRNGYLNAQERRLAPFIYQTLQQAARQLQTGSAGYAEIETQGMQALAASGFRPEYFSIRRTDDLAEPGPEDTHLSILAAAWLGSARLIDNIQVTLRKL